ncbi:MAG: HAD family hydrolase [Planctomycetota bacterium]
MQRAVFLDRDGVLNASVTRAHTPFGSPRTIDEFMLLPRVGEAVKLLKDLALLVIVVTNQPEISRGDLSKSNLASMHKLLMRAMPIDDIFVCIHQDEENCECRKPKIGMLLSAAQKWNIDLQNSFFVGDSWRDIEAGRCAGCTTILIGCSICEDANPDYFGHDLSEAVVWISECI